MLGQPGHPVEIIGKADEFVARVAESHLLCQIPQDLGRIAVLLRLCGRQEIFAHVDFPPMIV